jgi:hypothetical protein
MPRADYYGAANHEAASKFLIQTISAANYSAADWAGLLSAPDNSHGLTSADPVQCRPDGASFLGTNR